MTLITKFATYGNFLIGASYDDIMDIDLDVQYVFDSCLYPQGAKDLVAFWGYKGAVNPCYKIGKWQKKYSKDNACRVWSESTRKRVATQVPLIKNWEIYNLSYEDLPDVKATWFIDPPYQYNKKKYTFNDIDYHKLANWTKERKGLAIACDKQGADWLDFKVLKEHRAFSEKKYNEMIYIK